MATRIAVGVVAALFVVLLVTGLLLTFRYRPDVSEAYASASGISYHAPAFGARRIHRYASFLFVAAVGGLAISSIGLFLVRRRAVFTAYPVIAGIAALAASFTGFLLPWDQLSLWAVTVGTNMQGYTHILRGHEVKFVLIGSREIQTADLSRWFWLHAVALPGVIVAILIALAFATRRAPLAPERGAGPHDAAPRGQY